MKQKIIKFLLKQLGYKNVIKEYPYSVKFGELTHNQANSIYHWIRMSGIINHNAVEPYISPSTMVDVNKKKGSSWQETYVVKITDELTIAIQL